MKLSEAILKGCEIRPRQTKGQWQDGNDGACVVGAAWVGGYSDYIPSGLMSRLIKENDVLGYTREQIAASLAEAGL
jgi:hypothetical protein